VRYGAVDQYGAFVALIGSLCAYLSIYNAKIPLKGIIFACGGLMAH
jgi:hypothetical protein